ncbi:MAG: sulfatase [Flavobacteriaceae bacterium]|nr:sulfatase [Flavobacteriaceae bacterium]
MKNNLFTIVILVIAIYGCKENKTDNTDKKTTTVVKPNIILILSDDHAWTDYGFMGHEIVQTPNLDRLADESVVFTRGYVPTPVCRPSLMTLATGLYPHQHKITGNDPFSSVEGKSYFPREDLLVNIDSIPTLPRLLAEQGYLSHQSGKWWEGDYKRGGFTHGMTEGTRHGDKGLTIGREGLEPIYNFVDYAVSEEKPFFLWYAPFLPHKPHNPPQRLLDKYTDKDLTPSLAKYYAMIEWFDETCGELIDFLDKKGLRENTVIYYVSDNGWIQQPNGAGFDFGSKQSALDGGVRTPIMISWPGKLKPAIREDVVSSIDFFPTMLSIAGIEPPANLPGLNLWPELTTGKPIERKIIFGEAYGHDIMEKDNPEASLANLWCIENNWKLILAYDGKIEGHGSFTHKEMRKEPVRLYDILMDPYEKVNLAKQQPKVVERLTRKIENWYPLKERKLFVKNN